MFLWGMFLLAELCVCPCWIAVLAGAAVWCPHCVGVQLGSDLEQTGRRAVMGRLSSGLHVGAWKACRSLSTELCARRCYTTPGDSAATPVKHPLSHP